MSLIGALNVGKSALAVQQAAIQVTSNNIANAGSAGYTRQSAATGPVRDQQLQPGVFIGAGINLESISRQIDQALEGRLRGSISDQEAAETTQQWLGRVESLFNELSDQDLSTQLSTFFNAWSNLANKPQDIGLRQVVIQSGDTVAKWFTDLRRQLSSLQTDVDARLKAQTDQANSLAQQAADLNQQIVIAEGGAGGQANGLRDQRDTVLKQLSQLADIKTVERDAGVVDVYVGSEPLVIGTQNRGVALRSESVAGNLETTVTFKANDGAMRLSAGQLGAMDSARQQIGEMIEKVDSLAGNLIFELNKVHSSGQGLEGFHTVSATNQVADSSAALNSAQANLAFAPSGGSFVVHVRNKSTGFVTSTRVQVDLDGAGGNDTTLNSLQSDLDGIANMSASIQAGKLRIAAESNSVEVSFSQDSSGVLAALGINGFFTGRNANDIAISGDIMARPSLLAAAQNGERGDNQAALSIAALESNALAGLNGASLKEAYQAAVNGIATQSAAAKTNAEATRVVRETLEAQRESLSGVSLDEEAINLVRQQRAFQAAARLIAAVDEMMETLLAIA
jgi:flagellar hook-associated protein 1 FlgK